MNLPQYGGKKEKNKTKTGKRKRKRLKKQRKEENDEEKSLEASHPSMKGQRPQEHWIGMTENHRRRTRCPETSLLLQSASPVIGIIAVGRGQQESICVWSSPNPDSIIGEANVQNPSLQQTYHTKIAFKFNSQTPAD